MKKELNIPELLRDITLNQWQQIAAIPEDSEDGFYGRRVLSIIYDLKGSEINTISATDISKLLDPISKCLTEKPEFIKRFTMGGVEYGLIPNFDDMSFGELVDIDKYSSKETYHKMMGILYRPVTKVQSGDRYEIESYNGAKDMGSMPVDVALGVLAFFLTIGEQLINDTLNSLTEEEQAAAKKFLSVENGAGTPLSMPSVMEILYK